MGMLVSLCWLQRCPSCSRLVSIVRAAHSEIGGSTECYHITVTEATNTINTNEKQDASRKAILLRDHILEFQNAISAIEKCPQPVIGAAHGISFGLAIDILCACDIRYAASDVRFSIKVIVISRH